MSRVVTPKAPQTPSVSIPQEKIAMRAYEKWIQKGRPEGTDQQNWMEAEAELRAEWSRQGPSTLPHR